MWGSAKDLIPFRFYAKLGASPTDPLKPSPSSADEVKEVYAECQVHVSAAEAYR